MLSKFDIEATIQHDGFIKIDLLEIGTDNQIHITAYLPSILTLVSSLPKDIEEIKKLFS